MGKREYMFAKGLHNDYTVFDLKNYILFIIIIFTTALTIYLLLFK